MWRAPDRRITMASFENQLQAAADLLQRSRYVVALTGAGISTESGIPDFRSPTGVWSRYRTVLFDEFLESEAARREYWQQKVDGHDDMARAVPNVGHQVLANWEARRWLRGLITQNIDGLHAKAGQRQMVELHGNVWRARCLDCEATFAIEPFIQQFRQTSTAPPCPACGGRLKHDTISFGQSLAPSVLMQAWQWTAKSDLFFAIGSSLVVTPASELPRLARARGARVIIINGEPTPLDAAADVVFHAPIGKTLSALDRIVSADPTCG